MRTPIGKYGGALAARQTRRSLAYVVRALLARNENIDPEAIEDVIAGDANQAGEDNRNVARMAALLAGLPVSVAGSTVNRLCASGLQAIMDAIPGDHVRRRRSVYCGRCGKYVPCAFCDGETDFSIQPETGNGRIQRSAGVFRIKNLPINITLIQWVKQPKMLPSDGKYHGMHRMSLPWNRRLKYFAALAAEKWNDEIVAVELVQDQLVTWFTRDEHPRETSLEKLAGSNLLS